MKNPRQMAGIEGAAIRIAAGKPLVIYGATVSFATRASCSTCEQFIPRLSASEASHAGSDTFFRTARVSVAAR